MSAPDRLRLSPDGTLFLDGGGDVATYLSAWAAPFFRGNDAPAMPVCLLERGRLQELLFVESLPLSA